MARSYDVKRHFHQRHAACHGQTVSHNVVSSTHLATDGFRTHNYRVIGSDCIGSCKSNYHTITTTMASVFLVIKQVNYIFL